MSGSPAALAHRWRSFLFLAGTGRFFRRFSFVLYPYCLVWIWTVDWSFYAALSPFVYEPIGIAGVVDLPFPGTEALFLCRAAATAAALAAMFGFLHRAAAAVFFACVLLLDAWHNMFGFVNAQIHLVWFCGLMVLASRGEQDKEGHTESGLSGIAFRCMELVTVLVYVQAGIAKLAAGGLDWALEGTTTQIALVRQGVPAGTFLAEMGGLMPVVASASLLLEVAFLLYYPLARWRAPLLLLAITFHLGTWATMGISFSHLYIFSASALLLAPDLIGPMPGGSLLRRWRGPAVVDAASTPVKPAHGRFPAGSY